MVILDFSHCKTAKDVEEVYAKKQEELEVSKKAISKLFKEIVGK